MRPGRERPGTELRSRGPITPRRCFNEARALRPGRDRGPTSTPPTFARFNEARALRPGRDGTKYQAFKDSIMLQ